MAVEDEIAGHRPGWAQLLDIVERYTHQEETIEELRWLRDHPVDWLMATRYLRSKVDNEIARDRKALSDIPPTDPVTGRSTFQYLNAKQQMDKLNRKRLLWKSKIDAQVAEAKYLIGGDHLEEANLSMLVERLVSLRTAVISEYGQATVLRLVDGLLRTYAPDFEPDYYRPRYRGRSTE